MIGPAGNDPGDVIAGYAFDSFKLSPSANDAYRRSLGAGTVSADMSNAWVVKPEVNLWLDSEPHARPERELRVPGGAPHADDHEHARRPDKRSIHADVYMFKLGLVYKDLLTARAGRLADCRRRVPKDPAYKPTGTSEAAVIRTPRS